MLQGRLALQEVFAQQAPVVSGFEQPRRHRDGVGCVRAGDKLLGYHRVKPGGHHGARHDFDALTWLHLALPGLACQGGTHYLQMQGCRALELRPIKSKAIHGRVVVRGHADGGHHVLGKHPPQRLKNPHGFLLDDRFNQAGQKFVHAGNRQ